jgi:subtilisin family serine protease
MDLFESVAAVAATPQYIAQFGDSAELVRRAAAGRERGGRGRTIALIDGAPDLEVEDLAGAEIEPRRFSSSDAGPSPHASHAACLIAGQGHIHTRGLAPQARLLAAAVVEADEGIEPRAIAAAIEWAVAAGADVVALPLGAHDDEPMIARAVAAAVGAGAVVVAAAGNAHPYPVLFPARLPDVLAVGACDGRGSLLEDCCRRPRLDLVFPALTLVAPVGRGRVAGRSGTSVATALAAGLLATARQSEREEERRWQT